MPETLATLQLTIEEIDVLAIAAARSVAPDWYPADAREASRVIWSHAATAGTILCSLATALAEARIQLEREPQY